MSLLLLDQPVPKERIESRSQLVRLMNAEGISWISRYQRKELKADHNKPPNNPCTHELDQPVPKERIESRSQLLTRLKRYCDGWISRYQRKELKADHNCDAVAFMLHGVGSAGTKGKN